MCFANVLLSCVIKIFRKITSVFTYKQRFVVLNQVPVSIVVNMSVCHTGDRCSIPRQGVPFYKMF